MIVRKMHTGGYQELVVGKEESRNIGRRRAGCLQRVDCGSAVPKIEVGLVQDGYVDGRDVIVWRWPSAIRMLVCESSSAGTNRVESAFARRGRAPRSSPPRTPRAGRAR